MNTPPLLQTKLMTKKFKTEPSCADEHDPNSISVEQALELIFSNTKPLSGWEKLAIRDSLNRVAYEPVTSPINVPPYTNSAMDGFAISSTDLSLEAKNIQLEVIGKVLAGYPFDGIIQPGQCVRIMTGGMLPAGSDTVVMQEHVKIINENRILINSDHKSGQHVRHSGEDVGIGQVVLQKGQYINPAELGMLASLGIPEILVYRPIRVAFFSTGDELQTVGRPLKEGQIYDSNRYTLYGMLKRQGAQITDMGTIPDDRAETEAALSNAAHQCDVIITSGGVSVGEADFVKQTLDKLGSIDFWRIAMKPGKPLAFGKIGQCLFFGLPGNPVSTMVTFYQFVLPALERLSGKARSLQTIMEIPSAGPIKKNPGRMEFQRGIIETDESGNLVVRSTGEQGSGILSSMSQANCFILLPEECAGLDTGAMVKVQPFYGLL